VQTSLLDTTKTLLTFFTSESIIRSPSSSEHINFNSLWNCFPLCSKSISHNTHFKA